MRKFLSALILLTLIAGTAYAQPEKIGILSALNVTQDEYSGMVAKLLATGGSKMFSSAPSSGSMTFTLFKLYSSL